MITTMDSIRRIWALNSSSVCADKIVELMEQLREAKEKLAEDSRRLDELEKLVAENPGGLLIHRQQKNIKWTGVGLGLSRRPLRKAIDDAAQPAEKGSDGK